MITKKIKTKNETFTMVTDAMLESTKLNSNEKMMLSYILRWQMVNKECRLSNKALAVKLGLSIDSIKRMITTLKEFSFFTSEKHSYYNEFGTWCNYKIMRVNESQLSIFLNENKVELITDNTELDNEDIEDIILTPEAVLSLPADDIQPMLLVAEDVIDASDEANTSLPGNYIQPIITTDEDDHEDEYDEEENSYDEEIDVIQFKPLLTVPVELTLTQPLTIIDGVKFELTNDVLDLPGDVVEAVKTDDNDSYFHEILDKYWDEIKVYKKEKRSVMFLIKVDNLNLGLPSKEFQNYIHNIEPFAKDWFIKNEPIAA